MEEIKRKRHSEKSGNLKIEYLIVFVTICCKWYIKMVIADSNNIRQGVGKENVVLYNI